MLFTIIGLIFWLLALVVAITVHEYAHALAADKLGDPTPRMMDRMSLNPLKHYDRIGTTMMLVTAILRALGAPIIPIGWAKPVQFDPYNLKSPRRDAAIISLAGPVSNFVVAILTSVIIRLLHLEFSIFGQLALAVVTLNVVLGLFNLVPIHPLDGGKILVGILPRDVAYEADRVLHQYGMLILILLILPVRGSSPIFALIGPAMDWALRILLP